MLAWEIKSHKFIETGPWSISVKRYLWSVTELGPKYARNQQALAQTIHTLLTVLAIYDEAFFDIVNYVHSFVLAHQLLFYAARYYLIKF